MSRADAVALVAKAARELAAAIQASDRAADARRALGIDCTRARMTSANARWMTAAEDRDRKDAEFRSALTAAGYLDD